MIVYIKNTQHNAKINIDQVFSKLAHSNTLKIQHKYELIKDKHSTEV